MALLKHLEIYRRTEKVKGQQKNPISCKPLP
jgi:hypothetical protein